MIIFLHSSHHFRSSKPMHSMWEFQSICIFQWEIRRMLKQKGILGRIICEHRQMARDMYSSSECQGTVTLQKPAETHVLSLVITLERGAGHQFSSCPQSVQKTNVFVDLISCTTEGHISYASFFIYLHDTSQRNMGRIKINFYRIE